MLILWVYSFVMFFFSMVMMFIGVFLYLLNESFFVEWVIYFFSSMSFNMLLYIDYMSMMFLSVVLLITSMVLIYSFEYMGHDNFFNRFSYLILLFVTSMCLMILSPNIMSILLGWDGLGLISYCLVIYYQSNDSYNSGFITILINRVGDIGLLMLICFSMTFGSWNLMLYKMDMIMMLMLLMAVFTKSAQMPFSLWLPMAMTAPTPVSSLVHSSTLVTAGVYLLIRYIYLFDIYYINLYLLFISVFTMLVSGLMANFEYDLKKMVALSTLSQLGFMISILSLGFCELAFFHLIIHAIFKSLMFLCSGSFIHSMNMNQDIRNFSGLIYIYPFKSMVMIISIMSLSGFPFLSGFYSKDMIIELFLTSSLNILIMIMFYVSLILTVSYSIKLVSNLFFKDIKMFNSYTVLIEDKVMSLSLLVLMILSIFMGFFYMMLVFNKYIIVMTSFDKVMILKISVFSSLMNYKLSKLNSSVNMKNFLYFITSMMYLNFLYKLIYVDLFKFMIIYEDYYEKNWMEELGALYFYNLFYLTTKFDFMLHWFEFIIIFNMYMYMFLLMLFI